MTIPKRVLLREDGPREGFQMQSAVFPTLKKVELIDQLSLTGISSIEITSFVRPDRIPQLADAEQVASSFKPAKNVRYRALYLNEQGFKRALLCPQVQLEGYVLLAASETFLQKNSNTTFAEALSHLPHWIELFRQNNLRFERVMLSTSWGDSYEGKIEAHKVIEICRQILEVVADQNGALEEITFADTTGYADPEGVRRLIGEFRSRWPQIIPGLHLHDTRGTGMANVYAGLLEGIERFDCSVGGLGGCPFAKGAAGNVPTEDVAFLCHELGIETGINLEKYIECAKFAENLIGKKLPGKLKDGGIPFRK